MFPSHVKCKASYDKWINEHLDKNLKTPISLQPYDEFVAEYKTKYNIHACQDG